MLDNIFSGNVSQLSKIPNNKAHVLVLRSIFESSILGKEYDGNEYIWNTFNTYILNKRAITVNIGDLDKYCQNKNLLKLLFHEFNQTEFKMGKDNKVNDVETPPSQSRLTWSWSMEAELDRRGLNEKVRLTNKSFSEFDLIKSKNQNLLKCEILKLFKNVEYLGIECYDYPLSMHSLLDLIKATQVKQVHITGHDWLDLFKSSASFDDIMTHYQKANLDITASTSYIKISYNLPSLFKSRM